MITDEELCKQFNQMKPSSKVYISTFCVLNACMRSTSTHQYKLDVMQRALEYFEIGIKIEARSAVANSNGVDKVELALDLMELTAELGRRQREMITLTEGLAGVGLKVLTP